MKYSLVFAAQAASVMAFPALVEELAKRQSTAAPDLVSYFDASLQYVSTTGEHAFVAPNFEAGDVRGPCPGLNAMANHGYLPHNGVGSHTDFIAGTEAGMNSRCEVEIVTNDLSLRHVC